MSARNTILASALSALLCAGTAALAGTPRAELLPQDEAERALRGIITEDDVHALFGAFRALIDGGQADLPGDFEKRMDALSEELPKRLAPLLNRALDAAEKEAQRALREGSGQPRQSVPKPALESPTTAI